MGKYRYDFIRWFVFRAEMARKIRIQYPGATYHIMSRGDHYDDIFLGDKDREVFLKTLEEACEKTFRRLNIFRDNAAGRKNYVHYMELALIEVLDPKKLEVFEKKWNKIRRGWYLGDDTFKEKMLKQAKKVLKGKKDSSYYGSLMRDHSEKSAEELILRALKVLGIHGSDFHKMRKNDPYKQAIAWILKTQTVMKNQWIADQLHMGHWTSVTKAVKNVRETKNREIKRLKKKLENIL